MIGRFAWAKGDVRVQPAVYTVEQMTAHVKRLAQAFGIAITVRPRAHGRAWRKTRTIRIPPIIGPRTYAIALHELGHIIGPYPSGRLKREAAAWDWAEQHADIWTDEMSAKRAECLRNYAQWAVRRQSREKHGRTFITKTQRIIYGVD